MLDILFIGWPNLNSTHGKPSKLGKPLKAPGEIYLNLQFVPQETVLPSCSESLLKAFYPLANEEAPRSSW